jgi:hypothetical protein
MINILDINQAQNLCEARMADCSCPLMFADDSLLVNSWNNDSADRINLHEISTDSNIVTPLTP